MLREMGKEKAILRALCHYKEYFPAETEKVIPNTTVRWFHNIFGTFFHTLLYIFSPLASVQFSQVPLQGTGSNVGPVTTARTRNNDEQQNCLSS